MDFTANGAQLDGHARNPYFHFSAEAQEFFNNWYLELDRKRRSESEDIMVEHLSKFDSLMPSLALIFHLVEIAAWNLMFQGPYALKDVHLHCAQLAVQWCSYLESPRPAHLRPRREPLGAISQEASPQDQGRRSPIQIQRARYLQQELVAP